jgi:AAA domain
MTAALCEMTLDELAGAYDSGDEDTMAAVLAEAERRDAADEADRKRRERNAKRFQRNSGWYDAAFAQYLQAEAQTRGNLLSRLGLAEGIEEPFTLWSGPEAWAMARASEELREFWLDHPRLTVTAYAAQKAADGRAAREEWEAMQEAEEALEAGLDEDEATEPEPAAAFPTFAGEDHEPLDLEWNWQDRLPRGKVVILAGWRESGKGLVGWSVAAAVTNGWPLPGETEGREPGDVVGVWAEDDAQEDNAWRARAAGADLARVHDMSVMPGGTPFELSAARADMGHIPDLLGFIRQLREAGRNPRLVILDPLDNLVMNGTIQSKQGATRLIRRLEFVARRTGVTVLVVHHLVETSKSAAGKVGGSSKVVDVPRWVYRIERDEQAPELLVLRLHKGNQGQADDIRYRVVRDGHDSRVEWVAPERVQAEERSWRKPRLRAVPEYRRAEAPAWKPGPGGYGRVSAEGSGS